ncbi:MAG: hypothetical protein WDO14_24220 [Bacteroidota bacterium]
MKTINLLLLFSLFVSCAATSNYGQNPLDELFVQNFNVLEDYSTGKISRSQLSIQQKALMYLLMDWTGRPAEFDHYKGMQVATSDVHFWRKWYSTNKHSLDVEMVQKAMAIQIKVFSEGILSHEELEFLDKTSREIRAL